jgi:outer membrane biosynthesis protein TonB
MKRNRPTTLEPISAAMFLIMLAHAGLVAAGWWWWQQKLSSSADAGEARLTWMSPADFKSTLQAAVPPPVVTAKVPESKKAGASAASALKPVDTPVQKATLIAPPPAQLVMEPVPNPTSTPLFAPANPAPKPSANRSITLRRMMDKPSGSRVPGSPAPPMASPTLLDVARLNTLRPPPMPPPGTLASAAPADEADMDAVDEALNTAFLAGWTAPPIDAVPATQREARLNISIGRDGSVLKAQMSKFSGSHVLDQSILEAASKVKKISAALPSNFSKESYDLELNFLLLP